MGARAQRRLLALIAALGVAAGPSGCAVELGTVAHDHGIRAVAVVRLDAEHAVAARLRDGRVEVVGFALDGESWRSSVRAGSMATAEGRGTSVDLVSMDGATGETWNSFLYGVAPPEASRVRVVVTSTDRPVGEGGQVVDGAWVVACENAIRSDDLRWEVVDSAGVIIESGRGITPDD